MARFQAPRGTRDLLPGEIERWQWVEAVARDVFDRYCYDEIRTPLFEEYELFARSSGEASEMATDSTWFTLSRPSNSRALSLVLIILIWRFGEPSRRNYSFVSCSTGR